MQECNWWKKLPAANGSACRKGCLPSYQLKCDVRSKRFIYVVWRSLHLIIKNLSKICAFKIGCRRTFVALYVRPTLVQEARCPKNKTNEQVTASSVMKWREPGLWSLEWRNSFSIYWIGTKFFLPALHASFPRLRRGFLSRARKNKLWHPGYVRRCQRLRSRAKCMKESEGSDSSFKKSHQQMLLATSTDWHKLLVFLSQCIILPILLIKCSRLIYQWKLY